MIFFATNYTWPFNDEAGEGAFSLAIMSAQRISMKKVERGYDARGRYNDSEAIALTPWHLPPVLVV